MLSKFKIVVRGKESQIFAFDPAQENQTNLKDLGSLHHIHVIDRSGSMSGSLDRLIDDVQMIFKHIADNDYLTVIWFSSDNQFRTVVKAAKKSDDIKKLLDTLRSTVGCTCFSDPMREVGLVVEDTISLCPNIVVTLFTDGQPCCARSTDLEMELTLKAVSKYADKVLAVNTVGYGNYYDQSFLKKISALTQYGIMTHSRRIEEYFKIFQENINAVSEMVNKKTEIKAPGAKILYLAPSSSKMEVSELTQRQRSKSKNLYFVVDPKTLEIDGAKQDLSKAKENVSGDAQDFAYALAYQHYYNNERREALNIVADFLKDKTLADEMTNAFTFDECSGVVESLKNALYKNVRHPGTCSDGYLPADDAPCVLELVNALAASEAKYIPFSKNVESYKRIGKKVDESYSTFHRYEFKTPVGYFSDLVYSDERLNLSVKFTIPGYVQLNPMSAKKVNLPEQIPTDIFRTHTLIKDGQLNLKKIEVEIEEVGSDLNKFFAMGVLQKVDDRRYIIELSKLPIINNKMVNSASIEKIFESTRNISKLEAYQKVVKYHMDQISENAGDEVKKTGIFSNLNPDQIKVLEEHGLSDKGWYKGFQTVAPKAEESDYYEARLMKFYIKGVTTLPSINKYLEAKAKNKVTTTSLLLLENSWKDFEKLNVPSGATLEAKRAIENELRAAKKKLNTERMLINGVKISKALNNDWFPGLKTDEKGNYLYEDKSGDTLVLRADRTNVYFTADED